MNSSWPNNSSEEARSPSSAVSQTVSGSTTASQVIYSIVSLVALLGNTLVILVFIFDKKLLKKSYNTLIFSLAIADVLTAMSLITNPAFVLGDSFPYPTGPVLGELFCRLIWSRAILFQLVVFSVYICLALTAERWFAVVKPHKYNDAFSRKKITCYIFSSWVFAFLSAGSGMIETVYRASPNKICEFQFIAGGSVLRVVIGVFQSVVKMVFPCATMMGLYIHMIYTVKMSAAASAASKVKLRSRMTRIVGVVCCTLIICYAPNQILWVFALAGKVESDSEVHHATALLTFVASCVNPVIYGLSNSNYRERYKEILVTAYHRVCGGRASQANQPSVAGANGRQPRVHPGPQQKDIPQKKNPLKM